MLQWADISQSAADLRAAFGSPIQRAELWQENAKLPNEDTADTQRDRGCSPDGAGAIEAKRPKGQTRNCATPS
jgi:hypothetical protein